MEMIGWTFPNGDIGWWSTIVGVGYINADPIYGSKGKKSRK
jgi:hypothetical protein